MNVESRDSGRYSALYRSAILDSLDGPYIFATLVHASPCFLQAAHGNSRSSGSYSHFYKLSIRMRSPFFSFADSAHNAMYLSAPTGSCHTDYALVRFGVVSDSSLQAPCHA